MDRMTGSLEPSSKTTKFSMRVHFGCLSLSFFASSFQSLCGQSAQDVAYFGLPGFLALAALQSMPPPSSLGMNLMRER